LTFLKKQIDQALLIVAKYQGNLPFHLYIKEIFRNNKNWGSKDRKNYRNICGNESRKIRQKHHEYRRSK
jgi:hypothetical protein